MSPRTLDDRVPQKRRPAAAAIVPSTMTVQQRKWGIALAVTGAAMVFASVPVAPLLRVQDMVVAHAMGQNGDALPPVISVIPEHVVQNEDDLIQALNSDFQGKLILPAGRSFDLSRLRDLPLKSGVQLIGERGLLGSRPLVYTRTKGFSGETPVETINDDLANLDRFQLFAIVGNDVRVEGIHFRGSADGNRDESQPYVNAFQVVQNPLPYMPQGHNVVITENEFDEWTGAGVFVINPLSFEEGYFDKGNPLPHFGTTDIGLVRVERNYFHHNARLDGGYGVNVGGGAYATVEYNVFDFNRHAVTADGHSGGYAARFNYVLQGGFPYGNNGYYGQHFDVHGTAPGFNGGQAGEYFQIAFNTIRGEQDYGGVVGINESTRAAFELRGRPVRGAFFQANVVVHDGPGEAIRLKGGPDPNLNPPTYRAFNIRESDNRYDTDYSREVAIGDFDGDGLSDVFVANGTAWFFSRGGQRPWEFLHASTKRTRDLGFADIDNDGRTDVLYRDPNGALGYLRSGVKDLVNVTTVPVPIKNLRFGDFDGDGMTDIFYTLQFQWHIWYGRTRAWTATQSSSQSISELLFGEFDEVAGTDVVGVTGGEWSYSSGGSGFWTRLNDALRFSFADAVAADFDGNGRTDIAFDDGGPYVFSRDGVSPLATLRSAGATMGYPRLKQQLVGQFEWDAGAEVVSFEYKSLPLVNFYLPGERLVIWRGLPGPGEIGFFSNAYGILSEQNMR